jgi:hypothetical protein
LSVIGCQALVIGGGFFLNRAVVWLFGGSVWAAATFFSNLPSAERATQGRSRQSLGLDDFQAQRAEGDTLDAKCAHLDGFFSIGL